MIELRPTTEAGRHQRRWRMAILAGATLIGLAEASKAYAAYHLAGEPVSVGFVLLENLPWWYVWAAFVPVIVWLVRRVPMEGPHWWRGLAVHLPASLVLASAHLFLYSLLHYPAFSRGGRDPSFLAQEERFFSAFIFYEILTYWAIVLGCYVVIYYRRYRETALTAAQAEARAARLEAGRVEASLNALRMELHPHFLFNTLNSVSGLIRRDDTEAAVEMLARLGDLLRTTLDQRRDLTVPLAEEVAFLRKYLDIEGIRFGDRLTVRMDVAPEAEVGQVPPMILQPLVENAVRHGIADTVGPVVLRVSARVDGETMVLEVEDSGRGFPGGNGAPVREGVGLGNTRARLREMYHDRAGLTFAAADAGTVVRLWLPFEPSATTTEVAVGA